MLTLAFSRDIELPLRLIAARYLRLAIPAFAACLLALMVTTLVGTPNVEAGKITGSDMWLQILWQMPHGALFFFRDAILNSVVLGYQQTSTLSILALPVKLDDLLSSYVSPMWTLSAEFHGSLLVLLWTALHQKNYTLWKYVMIASAAFFAFTFFLCFAIGHLLGLRMKKNQMPRLLWPSTTGLIGMGALICIGAESWFSINLNDICKLTVATHLPCTSNYQHMIGAMFIFIGILLSPPLTRRLEAKSLVYIGKLSFSIYLVHWPIIMGVAPYLFLAMKDSTGELPAKLISSLLAFVISVLLAIPFSRVDDLAIVLSKKVKRTSHLAFTLLNPRP